MNEFVESNCTRRPDARIKLIDLMRRFTAGTAGKWPRWRVIDELTRLGFQIGTGSDGVHYVAGLGWLPTTRWEVDASGRMRLV